MSYKMQYLCLVIFGCFSAVAIVFLYFYIFGEDIVGKSCGDGNVIVPCETLENYVRRGQLRPGEKVVITIEIMEEQEKKMINVKRKELTVGIAIQNLTLQEKRKYVMEKLLLYKTHCGQQHWDDFYHMENETNGHDAHVYEFPWLVSLVNGDYRCSGFLISNRYFITTEECFRHGYDAAHNPKVGVHNIQKRVSCIRLPHTDDCTDGAKELAIQEGFKINSVVLVKLVARASFSYFVRPLCLPLEDFERPKIADTVVISGWGRLLDEEDHVSIKKRNHQRVIAVNGDRCRPEKNVSRNWICTLPMQNSTTACWGDEGSPTMYAYEDTWFAAGVAIVGPMCNVNDPVFSIAITPEVVNQILDTIYNDSYKSQQNSKKRTNS